MGKQVQWGILGYAGIARKKVIPAIQESAMSNAYAIASRDVGKLDEAMNTFGFEKLYNNYEALLQDPGVDAVYIPLPNALHKEWAIKAIRAGKHVLCEKPMAQTPEDCIEMLNCAKEHNVILAEAFMYRFGERIKILRKLLEDKVIGDITSIYSTHRFVLTDNSNVRVNAPLGGGSIWDVGCYPVNFIGMILDQEPISVKAECAYFQGVDCVTSAILRYPNNVMCMINSGFNGQGNFLTEISGTKGLMIIRETFSDLDKDNPAPILLIQNSEAKEIPIPAFHTYTMEIDAFCRAILEGKALPYDSNESVRTARVINRILEAAK